MGLMEMVLGGFLGGGRNVVRETAEVFRENAEAGAVRTHDARMGAMSQFAAEFLHPRRGLFDRFMDGLNRLPRPAMALGTIGLFVAAMVDPEWFASRMIGIALVPEPLWWLLGAVVSFYFGARYQMKGQEFQRSLAKTIARLPQVQAYQNGVTAAEVSAGAIPDPVANDAGPGPATPQVARTEPDAKATLMSIEPSGNAAVDDWRRSQIAAQ